MAESKDPLFVHRHIQPRFDSICTTCFMTIASGNTEAELAEDEAQHACREEDLHRMHQHDPPEPRQAVNRIHLIR
jgi:hypothetical protein